MAAKKEQPTVKECAVSYSSGGKVGIVKFDMTMDYHLSRNRTYSIPEGWTDAQVKKFQDEKSEELRGEVEEQAQKEFDRLVEMSEIF